MKEVKDVIENTFTQSKKVMRALRRLEQAGYQPRLIISTDRAPVGTMNLTSPPQISRSNEPVLVLTDLDTRFLKALRIKTDQ
jgi:hypothetical protein